MNKARRKLYHQIIGYLKLEDSIEMFLLGCLLYNKRELLSETLTQENTISDPMIILNIYLSSYNRPNLISS